MPFSPPCWSPTWAWSCLFCSNARMVSSSVLCWRIRSWKIAHFVEWRWTCVGLAHFIYSFILVLNVLWAWGMKIPLFRCGLVSLVWPPFLSGVVSATAEALSALEVPRRKELSVHCPIVLFIPLLCCWFRQVTSVPTRKADTTAQKPLAPFFTWPSLMFYLSCGPQLLRLWWALPKCLGWSFTAELGLGAWGEDQVDEYSSLPQPPSQEVSLWSAFPLFSFALTAQQSCLHRSCFLSLCFGGNPSQETSKNFHDLPDP